VPLTSLLGQTYHYVDLCASCFCCCFASS